MLKVVIDHITNLSKISSGISEVTEMGYRICNICDLGGEDILKTSVSKMKCHPKNFLKEICRIKLHMERPCATEGRKRSDPIWNMVLYEGGEGKAEKQSEGEGGRGERNEGKGREDISDLLILECLGSESTEMDTRY